MAASDRSSETQLGALLRKFARSKRPIQVSFRELLPSVSYGDRLTHFIHSYPGKLLPHIPHFFLNNKIFTFEGATVLDPFCGSGTVLLETVVSNRRAIGADVNPLACLIAKVKTTPLNPSLIEGAIERLLARFREVRDCEPPPITHLEYWYHPHVIKDLSRLRIAIERTKSESMRDFFWIAFSSLVRRVSLADPRLSVPVRLRPDTYSPKHRLHNPSKGRLLALKTTRSADVFEELVRRNTERVRSLQGRVPADAKVMICQADARALSNDVFADRATANPELIITSPPYVGSQKYIRASSLNLGWLGLCQQELRKLDELTLGREKFRKQQYSPLPAHGDRKIDSLLA